jgi:hypothetical protein
MQESPKNLFTRSERIIAKGSGHYIQLDRPDVLTREVPIFVQQICLSDAPFGRSATAERALRARLIKPFEHSVPGKR